MRRIFYRCFQKIMYLLSFLMPFKEPKVMYHLEEVSKILANHYKHQIFIATDAFLAETSSFKSMMNHIQDRGMNTSVFSKTMPNPSIELIEEAYRHYRDNNCDAIIAYGGGSVMDLAKVVGARVVKPKLKIERMKGILKVRRKLPLLIAIPSTVGTGSEATAAAVVSNPMTSDKYAIMDPVFIPNYAVLDVEVVKSLPKHLIAETGMDTLTHAIEAYIGKANTSQTKKYALEAIRIVFNDLKKAYQGDLEALKNMQIGAYKAGVAFTRAYVGNVHAIAHQLTAYYQLPHGYSNGVILPHVLRYYGDSIKRQLREIQSVVSPNDIGHNLNPKKDLIDLIDDLKQALKIDDCFHQIIKQSDIEDIVKKAYKEANPLYPVPRIFNKNDFYQIIDMIDQ